MEKFYIYSKKFVVKQDLFTKGFYRLEQRDGEKQWWYEKSLGAVFAADPDCFEDISDSSVEDWIDDEILGEDCVYFIPEIIYEKHKAYSPLETAIKMFHVNRNSDIAIYMVLDALATEQIYIPHNSSGNLMSLILGDQEIIAVFSKPERLEKNEPVILRKCYIRDIVDNLISAGKNIVVNPFSEENIQFFLPYAGIERLLIPAIRNLKQSKD